jgi:hypothetical protein
MVPAVTSALTWRVRAPAARATSRAVKTAVIAEDMEIAGCERRKTLADSAEGRRIPSASFSAAIRSIC